MPRISTADEDDQSNEEEQTISDAIVEVREDRVRPGDEPGEVGPAGRSGNRLVAQPRHQLGRLGRLRSAPGDELVDAERSRGVEARRRHRGDILGRDEIVVELRQLGLGIGGPGRDLHEHEERIGRSRAEGLALQLPRLVLRGIGWEQRVVEGSEAQVSFEHWDREHQEDKHARRDAERREAGHGDGPTGTPPRPGVGPAGPRHLGGRDPRPEETHDCRDQGHRREHDGGHGDGDRVGHGRHGRHLEDEQCEERDEHGRAGGQDRAPDGGRGVRGGLGRRLTLLEVVLGAAHHEQRVVGPHPQADHDGRRVRDRRDVEEVLEDAYETDAEDHTDERADDRPGKRPPCRERKQQDDQRDGEPEEHEDPLHVDRLRPWHRPTQLDLERRGAIRRDRVLELLHRRDPVPGKLRERDRIGDGRERGRSVLRDELRRVQRARNRAHPVEGLDRGDAFSDGRLSGSVGGDGATLAKVVHDRRARAGG